MQETVAGGGVASALLLKCVRRVGSCENWRSAERMVGERCAALSVSLLPPPFPPIKDAHGISWNHRKAQGEFLGDS